jgi:hypothetical protein
VTGPGQAAASAALERLAEELDSSEFTTVIILRSGQRPRLTVEYHPTRAVEDIYADGWYWWASAEPIAPANDPAAAARQVTTVLGRGPYEQPDPPATFEGWRP